MTRDHHTVPDRHDAAVPFRWDLLAPDRLGSMPPASGEVDLWFLPDLLEAAGRVLTRRVLTDVGITPETLSRRRRPCTFVDVVHAGATFTELFTLLRGWVVEGSPGAWPVVRRKLRFLGVTRRGPTTPHAFRWQQEAPWTRDLPAASVVNVSLDPAVWSYLGDDQAKLPTISEAWLRTLVGQLNR